jgi:hypothetical protein
MEMPAGPGNPFRELPVSYPLFLNYLQQRFEEDVGFRERYRQLTMAYKDALSDPNSAYSTDIQLTSKQDTSH